VNGWSRSTVPTWCRVVDPCECGNEPSSALLFYDIAFFYLPYFAAQNNRMTSLHFRACLAGELINFHMLLGLCMIVNLQTKNIRHNMTSPFW